MELAAWERIAQTFGIPVAIMVVCGIALAKIVQWSGPRVDKIVSAHAEFLTSTRETQKEILTVQQKLSESITAHDIVEVPKLERLIDTTDAIHERTGMILDRLPKVPQ